MTRLLIVDGCAGKPMLNLDGSMQAADDIENITVLKDGSATAIVW